MYISAQPERDALKQQRSSLAAGRDDDNEGQGEQQMEAEAAEASGSPQDPAEASTVPEDLDADQDPDVWLLHQAHDSRDNPDCILIQTDSRKDCYLHKLSMAVCPLKLACPPLILGEVGKQSILLTDTMISLSLIPEDMRELWHKVQRSQFMSSDMPLHCNVPCSLSQSCQDTAGERGAADLPGPKLLHRVKGHACT